MLNVVVKPLPHGTIPVEGLDARTKDLVVQINENIVAIKKQMDAQAACLLELSRSFDALKKEVSK